MHILNCILKRAFATYQKVFKPLGSHPPIQTEVFSEKTSNILPPSVGHEACHRQLSHVGVHKGHSCLALCDYK